MKTKRKKQNKRVTVGDKKQVKRNKMNKQTIDQKCE